MPRTTPIPPAILLSLGCAAPGPPLVSGRRIPCGLAAGELYAGEGAIYPRTIEGGDFQSVSLSVP